jgi:tripartite-type tricarboxylate transporter receptor subunit TctC
VTTPTRWPSLPDIPTLREAGYTDLPGSPWGSLLAPPKTPAPVAAKLNATVNEILRTPEVAERLGKLNMLPRPLTLQEFAAMLDKEIPIWTDVNEAPRVSISASRGARISARRQISFAVNRSPCAPARRSEKTAP